MDSLDLKLLHYLQENGELNTQQLPPSFKRSESSIYRRVESINQWLPEGKQLIMTKHVVSSCLTYNDYIEAVQSIPFLDYRSSQEERIHFIVIQSLLKGVVNTSRFFNHLGLSIATKKKDNRYLTEWLDKKDLTKTIARKKGIVVEGQEIYIRIESTKILMSYLELDAHDKLVLRKANNPMEVLMAEYFLTEVSTEEPKAHKLIADFMDFYQIEFSYPSKKFLVIYLTIMFLRSKAGKCQTTLIDSRYHPQDHFHFVSDEVENTILNGLFCAQDTMMATSPMLDIHDQLMEESKRFVEMLQSHILTHLYTKENLIQEIYYFIYKCHIRKNYHFSFYDNKLEDTQRQLPNLYHLIKESPFISDVMKLSDDQVSTLALLVRKHIMENKLLGRNTKRIVVVTNSSIEKADFFTANLNHFLDIEVVKIIHINEIFKLEQLDYDFILTFSNRLETLIKEQGFSCKKLNYYFHQQDIDELLQAGFSSSSRRKILAEPLLKQVDTLSKEDRASWLRHAYPSHFL